MAGKSTKRLYLIPVLSKALDILELLQAEGEPMSLESIHRRSAVSKTTVYRILKTFVHRGYLSRGTDGLYRVASRPRKLRFGFAAQSGEMPFSVAVTESVKAAALAAGVDLLVLDNQYDAAVATENADRFVQAKVDLVIEFQVEQHAAPVIADKIAAAGIPMIAIDIPHPHATFFGVDNYRVGCEAGGCLARYALETWKGRVDWVLGLDLAEAGLLVQSRITGAFETIRAALPELPVESFVRMDGRGIRETSRRLVAEFLGRHGRARGILIAAANDSSALGAVDAVRAARRGRTVAIVGQDAIPEALAELEDARSPLLGTVSHEAATYGAEVMRLALSLLHGSTVPPYNYVQHRLAARRVL